MHTLIRTKMIGKSHEVRVERSSYTIGSRTEEYIYVMVFNHDVCCENKEYFDTEEAAIDLFNRFKRVSECKNFIKLSILP